MGKSVTLINNGGPLSFVEDNRGRSVAHGQTFDVSEETAKTLMDSDSNIRLASDAPPAPSAEAANAAAAATVLSSAAPYEYVSDLDFSKLKVGDLRDKLGSVGLPTEGDKADLASRMSAFQAGYEQGLRAGSTTTQGGAWAAMSPSPGAPLDVSPAAPHPSSSEAEPGAPPPPPGGLSPSAEAHQLANPDSGDTGAITLSDLGDGGKTK